MESKWRARVADHGWIGGPFRKIARVVSGLTAGWLITDAPVPGAKLWFPSVADGQFAAGVNVNQWNAVGNRFPYGLDVEPDTPA